MSFEEMPVEIKAFKLDPIKYNEKTLSFRDSVEVTGKLKLADDNWYEFYARVLLTEEVGFELFIELLDRESEFLTYALSPYQMSSQMIYPEYVREFSQKVYDNIPLDRARIHQAEYYQLSVQEQRLKAKLAKIQKEMQEHWDFCVEKGWEL